MNELSLIATGIGLVIIGMILCCTIIGVPLGISCVGIGAAVAFCAGEELQNKSGD